MRDPELETWIKGELPPAPASVLEIGAGTGELAAALREAGYNVTAIDPGDAGPGVERIALAELEAPPPGFDAAVAAVSLHHVQPLDESLETLAAALKPGSSLLVDEFDVDAVDARAADWLIARRGEHEHSETAADLIAEVRGHVHPLDEVRASLVTAGFTLGPVSRGAYLHRWNLPPGFADDERAEIEAGTLPRVGARFRAVRD